MELRRSYELTANKGRTFSISEAVEREVSTGGYDSGIAEQAASDAQAGIRFLGALVAKLHERGALTDDDVINLLGGSSHWKPHPQPDSR